MSLIKIVNRDTGKEAFTIQDNGDTVLAGKHLVTGAMVKEALENAQEDDKEETKEEK